MSTALIIGDIQESLRRVKWPHLLRRVETTEAFAEVYDEFTGLAQSRELVVHDVSLFSRSSRLAKFLEETNHRVLCLASTDNLDRVLLSRFQRIYKRDTGADLFSGVEDKREAMSVVSSGVDFVRAAMVHYPRAVPELIRVKHFRFGKRISELVLGGET